ncbi:hypothetical protein, partial [Coprobacillus cateniformis]|uniref:hypothetical protein n=1 Tax=Coprobacillus cateniformis TaxID=100884 RepID=UPI00321AEB2E
CFFLYLSQFLGTMTCMRRAVLHIRPMRSPKGEMEQRSLISSCMEDTVNKKPSKECKAPPMAAMLLTGLFLFCGG